jgi:adenosylcobinamide kinase/adenosylcobinamide-phosphate guanylyltransferase
MAPSDATLGGGVTLVLGGARSGKSGYAESLITSGTRPWVYVATAEARDGEMTARIAAHKARRDEGWQTIEAPHELPEALDAAPAEAAVLVDCLTVWLSNVMLAEFDTEKMTERLEEALARRKGRTVLVSNEVGLSIVPDNELARRFRDSQGLLNQRLVTRATSVVFMVAGLPIYLRGGP